MEQLRAEPSADHDLVMDWSWEGDESDEESKLRAETRKILELPDLAICATCVRVPVLVGHSEAIWVEFEEPLSPEDATAILSEAPSVRVLRLPEFPTPPDAPAATRCSSAGSAGRGLGERPRALPLVRQPPQGSGAERDPDRRGAARRCRCGVAPVVGALACALVLAVAASALLQAPPRPRRSSRSGTSPPAPRTGTSRPPRSSRRSAARSPCSATSPTTTAP